MYLVCNSGRDSLAKHTIKPVQNFGENLDYLPKSHIMIILMIILNANFHIFCIRALHVKIKCSMFANKLDLMHNMHLVLNSLI